MNNISSSMSDKAQISGSGDGSLSNTLSSMLIDSSSKGKSGDVSIVKNSFEAQDIHSHYNPMFGPNVYTLA